MASGVPCALDDFRGRDREQGCCGGLLLICWLVCLVCLVGWLVAWLVVSVAWGNTVLPQASKVVGVFAQVS